VAGRVEAGKWARGTPIASQNTGSGPRETGESNSAVTTWPVRARRETSVESHLQRAVVRPLPARPMKAARVSGSAGGRTLTTFCM